MLTSVLDEADRVHVVTRDAAIQDDGRDLVLVLGEDHGELHERGSLDDPDAVLLEFDLVVPDHSGEVVSDEDEWY
ncbi:MAG: hypothetical protein JWN75_765 [Candidatus Saccharibacteria bacterium]|nr:hypothetical protein [Candidatus Saccharibacteria bacterium]